MNHLFELFLFDNSTSGSTNDPILSQELVNTPLIDLLLSSLGVCRDQVKNYFIINLYSLQKFTIIKYFIIHIL